VIYRDGGAPGSVLTFFANTDPKKVAGLTPRAEGSSGEKNAGLTPAPVLTGDDHP